MIAVFALLTDFSNNLTTVTALGSVLLSFPYISTQWLLWVQYKSYHCLILLEIFDRRLFAFQNVTLLEWHLGHSLLTPHLPWLKIQATVTPSFTSLVTVTPFSFASFFQETSAFTRLIWWSICSYHSIKKAFFLRYSNVVLTEKLKKVFQTNIFIFKLHDEVLVGWMKEKIINHRFKEMKTEIIDKNIMHFYTVHTCQLQLQIY